MLSEEETEDDDPYMPASNESLPIASKMDIFLKVRPINSTDQNDSESDLYAVQDSSTLIVKNIHVNDNTRRSNVSKLNENIAKKKFKFSRIFSAETDQLSFFHEAMKPTVIDFLNNQSSTVISYGTADAGKTHTLFGTATDLGIIPRTIEFIYSSVNCTLVPWYKPKDHKTVLVLDESDRALEIDARKKLLSCRYVDKTACQEAYEALEKTERNKNSECLKDSMYSVWISFVEIYNDTVFDLLEVDEEGKNMQLKLSLDKDGSTYIQGMRSICATTGLEAYKILNAGQTRLSIDSTPAYKSSRSHSIFIIKLLKYERDADPSEVEVSCLSFCDLAGAGKIQKIIDNEKQFKESRSINTSLLAFGRYLKVLAEKHSRQSIGPFRDSKLTRLFQHSLRRENIILLINVNPAAELWAETQNVLNFASTAMKLTSDFTREDKRFLDYYTPICSPKLLRETHSSESVKAPPPPRGEEIDDLLEKNKQLLARLKDVESNQVRREFLIRQELTNSFTQQLNSLEENWKNRILAMEEEKEGFLQFSVDRVKDSYRYKFEEHVRRKRKRTEKSDARETLDVEAIELENSQSKTTISSLENTLEQLADENKQLIDEKNRLELELSLLKRNLMEMLTATESADENSENHSDLEDSENMQTCFDNDTIYCLQRIQDLMKKPSDSSVNQSVKNSKLMRKKGIQCSLVSEYLIDIKKLLCPSMVELPELEDSLDESNQSPEQNLNTLLPEIRDLILQSTSKITKLEAEKNEKSSHLELLRSRIEESEREILESRILYEESESARAAQSRRVEELEKSLKSREFFKNSEFTAVESENSWSNESHQLIFTEPHSSSGHSFNVSNSSSFDLDSEKINVLRSSSGSSGNDSGLASTADPVTSRSFDEKSCQTNSLNNAENNTSFQERLSQLKLDYQQMKAQHVQEALKVTELSKELKRIRETMERLKENTYAKERIIAEYQNKFSVHKLEIERLSKEKKKWENKCDELSKEFKNSNLDYEKKLTESQVKLKVYEEEENRATKCLEDYWQKSVNLGSELSIAYTELEKNSMKCYKDHVVRIDKLEKELSEKRMKETEMEVKIDQYKSDLSDMDRVVERVYGFENSLHKIQQEKIDLQKSLNVRSRNQIEIEDMLQAMTKRIEERDNHILSLRSEIDTVTEINLSNSRKAKELGREVAELLRKMCKMKDDIAESEEARKNLERNSGREISNLRARLTAYEENAELLNLISNANDNKQYETEKLKLKLLEKEKELEFFKKNRNSTIQRYECLVRQLQDALKMNHQPSKIKKSSSHKHKCFGSDLRESASCSIYDSIQKTDWKSLCDNNNYFAPFPSMRALMNSPAESSRVVSFKNTSLVNDESQRGSYSKVYPDSMEDLENQVETDS